MYQKLIKPFFDFLVALLAIIVTLPLLIVLMLLIRVFQGPRVFFVQDRIGEGERVIRIYKIRTMNDKRGPDGRLLPDEARLTSLGKFVRKTSLDELPQLFNVLKGDMSFVGPRPLLVEYLPLYSETQKRRHLVRPGISGWAQVNGRNAISWKKKFELDVWYVDHISLILDVRILLITLVKIIKAEGIGGEGVATMERFNGNN